MEFSSLGDLFSNYHRLYQHYLGLGYTEEQALQAVADYMFSNPDEPE